MFDISVLKEMKLNELQEIAKAAKIKNFKTLKKDDLVYQILDFQASNPEKLTPDANSIPEDSSKPKRTRMVKDKKEASSEPEKVDINQETSFFTEETDEKKTSKKVNNKKVTTNTEEVTEQKKDTFVKKNKNQKFPKDKKSITETNEKIIESNLPTEEINTTINLQESQTEETVEIAEISSDQVNNSTIEPELPHLLNQTNTSITKILNTKKQLISENLIMSLKVS
ncbi:hypothetical protein AX766_02465 [Flavobacterium covae]|nr:hypothetical protein AX766_02465 [Flavobacterium covae]